MITTVCYVSGGNAVGEGTHDERNTNPMPDDQNVDRLVERINQNTLMR